MIFPRSAILSSVGLAVVAAAAFAASITVAAEAVLAQPESAAPAPAKPETARPEAVKMLNLTPAKPMSGESEIRATAAAFVEAFNRGDAHAVADLWTADGTEGDESGTIYKGRPAIEAQYAELFKQHPGARMEVAVKTIEFPSRSTAIEDGAAQVEVERAGPPRASRYTAVHVKQDGKWLMASVRESSIELPSNFARVESLDWLVGTWKAERDGTALQTTVHWIANKSFLERDYTIRKDGIPFSSGKQIIGWDAKAGQIRSWSFDGAGGYGTGLWTATPDGWRIESTGVMADGTPTSSVDLVIRVPGEDNVLGWRSIAQTRAGPPCPIHRRSWSIASWRRSRLSCRTDFLASQSIDGLGRPSCKTSCVCNRLQFKPIDIRVIYEKTPYDIARPHTGNCDDPGNRSLPRFRRFQRGRSSEAASAAADLAAAQWHG